MRTGPRGRRVVPSSRYFAGGGIPDERRRANFAWMHRYPPLFRRATTQLVPRYRHCEDARSKGCLCDVRPLLSLCGGGGRAGAGGSGLVRRVLARVFALAEVPAIGF